jgi:glycosyltransferase involved in cell wall biosynthesis
VSFRGYPRVTTTGAVADVRPYLARAAVVAVPLRYGGGTRLKILEALAAGKAVVSTSLGAEGLELQDGQHLILADTPQAFADALIRLLTSPEEQRRLGTAGRDQVVKAYDWSVISERLLALYENVAQGSTCSPHRPSSTRERAMQ